MSDSISGKNQMYLCTLMSRQHSRLFCKMMLVICWLCHSSPPFPETLLVCLGLFQVCPAPQKLGDFIERLKEDIEKKYNVPRNPASNGDWALEEIGCDRNDKTEDVVISMVEVGMIMMVLMIIMIIIMPACYRWQLINNKVIKPLKVIRE